VPRNDPSTWPGRSSRLLWAVVVLGCSGACECGGRLQESYFTTDAGKPADAGPVPLDAGVLPPDAGSLAPDSGVLPPEPGCSDGTREGFLSLTQYPDIAACSGAWSVPGITAAGQAQGPVVPTCGRSAGNDSTNVDGDGCSAADLCAIGWHICEGYQEVAANAPAGCADAVPADAPNDNNANYVLFAIAQHSHDNTVCDDTPGDDNDIFGCGRFGQQINDSNNHCGVLDQALASTVPGTCSYSQAIPSNGPWQCLGSNSLNEGDFVTKNGCPNNSCSEGGYTFGSSDKGGVLCCRDSHP
jgi:hypothetical protein